MNLCTALRLHPGAIVAFSGSGGKTTAMLRLGRELAAAGQRVIATTTTRLGLDQLALFPAHLIAPGRDEITAALDAHGFVCVIGGKDAAQGKALGLDPAAAAGLATLADLVLVEADGSRGLPLKAPAPHEPVIPPHSTHVVTLAGLWALGQPLGPQIAHRPEIVARLSGLRPGQILTPAALARLLLHPAGPARGAPPGAERYLLLNGGGEDNGVWERVDRRPIPEIGSLTSRLAADRRFRAVLLGQTAHDPPILARSSHSAAIILAAGASTRFGAAKQLYDWHGQPLLRHVVLQALAAAVEEVIVVLGAHFAAIAPALHGLPITLVYNEHWAAGQSTSMQAGLRACAPGVEAALFLLGDQPHLPPALLHEILATHRRTLAPIVAPRHQGRRGNPVLFDRACFPELMAIRGDSGGRDLFQRYAGQVAWVEAGPEVLFDLDRPPETGAL